MPRKKKAVALKYNLEQDPAPVVIASGYGEVAERIINIAEERGIPVYRDDSTASMLCMLEVGASIPEELYQIVATIYIQIMESANRVKEGVNASVYATTSTLTDGIRPTVSEAAPSRDASTREQSISEAERRRADGVTAAGAMDSTSRVVSASELLENDEALAGEDTGTGAGTSTGRPRASALRARRSTAGDPDVYSDFLASVLHDEGDD